MSGSDRQTAEKVLRPVVEAARDEGRWADEDWEGTVLDSILSADLGLSTTEKNRLVNSLSERSFYWKCEGCGELFSHANHPDEQWKHALHEHGSVEAVTFTAVASWEVESA